MRAFRGFLLKIAYFTLCCLILANISNAENGTGRFSGPNSTGRQPENLKNENSKDPTHRYPSAVSHLSHSSLNQRPAKKTLVRT